MPKQTSKPPLSDADDQLSPEETVARRETILKRLLNTPPKPLKPKKEPTAGEKPKRGRPKKGNGG